LIDCQEDKDDSGCAAYWFSARSPLIFPCGWATRAGYTLSANQE